MGRWTSIPDLRPEPAGQPQEAQEEETQKQQPDPKRQKTSDHSMMPERPLTETELIKCEEILANASEIDLDGLIDPSLWG